MTSSQYITPLKQLSFDRTEFDEVNPKS